MRNAFLLLLVAAVPASAQDPAKSNQEAEALYQRHCASCHEGGVSRAPQRSNLNRLSMDAIRFALSKGTMAAQGANLTSAETDALVRYLASPVSIGAAGTALCSEASVNAKLSKESLVTAHWNGWGVDLSQSRFQPDVTPQRRCVRRPLRASTW